MHGEFVFSSRIKVRLLKEKEAASCGYNIGGKIRNKIIFLSLFNKFILI